MVIDAREQEIVYAGDDQGLKTVGKVFDDRAMGRSYDFKPSGVPMVINALVILVAVGTNT